MTLYEELNARGLVAQITEKTGGKAVMTREKECYYGFADGELVLF